MQRRSRPSKPDRNRRAIAIRVFAPNDHHAGRVTGVTFGRNRCQARQRLAEIARAFIDISHFRVEAVAADRRIARAIERFGEERSGASIINKVREKFGIESHRPECIQA